MTFVQRSEGREEVGHTAICEEHCRQMESNGRGPEVSVCPVDLKDGKCAAITGIEKMRAKGNYWYVYWQTTIPITIKNFFSEGLISNIICNLFWKSPTEINSYDNSNGLYLSSFMGNNSIQNK